MKSGSLRIAGDEIRKCSMIAWVGGYLVSYDSCTALIL